MPTMSLQTLSSIWTYTAPLRTPGAPALSISASTQRNQSRYTGRIDSTNLNLEE